MKTPKVVLLFFLTCLLAVATAAAQNATTASTPDAVIRELYRVHRNGYGHVFDKQGRKLQQKFFDAKLAALIWKDLTETPEGEVGNLDFDPLYNAQDTRIRNFVVGAPAITGERAIVPVSFTNFAKKERLKFSLVKEGGVWKIDNIDYGEFNLVKILNEPH